jgi:hypothetical protein
MQALAQAMDWDTALKCSEVTAPAFSYLREIETGMKIWWTRTAPVGTD